MTEFRPGDRVRVSYETTVHGTHEDPPWYVGAVKLVRPTGQSEMVEGTGTFVPVEFVELIEPVNDPSKDPLLTVRVDPEGNPSEPGTRRAIKLDRGAAGWAIFQDGQSAYWTLDRDIQGWHRQGPSDVERAVNGVGAVSETPEVIRVRRDKDGEYWFELEPGRWTWGGWKRPQDQAYRYASRQVPDGQDLVGRPTSVLSESTYAPFSEPLLFEVPAP